MQATQLQGAPVTLNLQPGELLPLTFLRSDSVDTSRRYEGRIVADVYDGNEEQVALVPDMVFWNAPVAGYHLGFGDSISNFQCTWPGEEPLPCSLGEARSLLDALVDASRR